MLRRRAEAAGAYVSIAKRGSDESGAVFVVVSRADKRCDLYGPAPQSAFGADQPADRLFSLLAADCADHDIRSRMEQEMRFDLDLWLIDIEDREGRAFLDVVAGPA